MLDPSLYIPNVPGLDEALPVDVYAELSNMMVESVIKDIQARRVLGVFHKGQWYVEAPAFCEEKLRKIWKTRKADGPENNQENQSQQSQKRHDFAANTHINPDFRFAKVLGLNGRVTREDVKRRWKELTLQYHPDKVAHLGPKLRDVAEREMKAINEAYDYFRTKYQI
jgi:hypothetical protein